MVRSVLEKHASEWLRMRLELWLNAIPDDLAEETAQFLVQGPSPKLPDLQAVSVCKRDGGSLCGFIEVSIHSSAPCCATGRIGYIEAR